MSPGKAIRRELALACRESRRTKQAARRFKILEDWETREVVSPPRDCESRVDAACARRAAKRAALDLTRKPRSEPLKPSMGAAVRDHRNAVRHRSECLSAIVGIRGDMQNRIKECQTDMFAGRTSAASLQANQLRLWFAAFAYMLLCALRRIGLTGTAMAKATCGTIRLKLLKIGALVIKSVRRVKIAMAHRKSRQAGLYVKGIASPLSIIRTPDIEHRRTHNLLSDGVAKFQRTC